MIVVTDAIVLRRLPFREDDLLVTLYTKKLGKIIAVAKGALKQSSKLRGHLEIPRIVRVMVARKHNSRYTLAQAVTVESFFVSSKYSYQAAALQIVSAYTRYGQYDSSIYGCVIRYLRNPDNFGKFIIEMSDYIGIGLTLNMCVSCKVKSSFSWWFDCARGGLICDECKSGGSKPLVVEDLENLLCEYIEWHTDVHLRALGIIKSRALDKKAAFA